jgi:hypothetical protein
MAVQRKDGEMHPGIPWGPFTFRIPFYHTRVEWPEFWQGIFVAGATGLGLVPLLVGFFGLSFEQAIAVVFIQTVLLSSAPIVFGEPYAPGWVTPALPLILATILPFVAMHGPEAGFQFMTAMSINFALLVIVLGVTGLGGRLIAWLPSALKGGIVMGAAIAALYRVFIVEDGLFYQAPFAMATAIGLCLILTFSLPLMTLKRNRKWLAYIAGLGLLPGFFIAGVVGPIMGEWAWQAGGMTIGWAGAEGFTEERLFAVQWGILLPPFIETFHAVSPFAIGWPSLQMFIDGIPLALMTYVILFGDLITGTEILKAARKARPDEKLSIDLNRTHVSIGIRNALMALFAPFFPTQGTLWTGVQVIIVQKWVQGRDKMDSLFSGITSYYVFGIPLLYMALPLLTLLEPLMAVALALTLVLTAFACAYVAMGMQRTNIERGTVVLIGFCIAIFDSPWVGMAIAIVATLALIGIKDPLPPEPEAEEDRPAIGSQVRKGR